MLCLLVTPLLGMGLAGANHNTTTITIDRAGTQLPAAGSSTGLIILDATVGDNQPCFIYDMLGLLDADEDTILRFEYNTCTERIYIHHADGIHIMRARTGDQVQVRIAFDAPQYTVTTYDSWNRPRTAEVTGLDAGAPASALWPTATDAHVTGARLRSGATDDVFSHRYSEATLPAELTPIEAGGGAVTPQPFGVGYMTDGHLELLGSRADGGLGAVTTDAPAHTGAVSLAFRPSSSTIAFEGMHVLSATDAGGAPVWGISFHGTGTGFLVLLDVPGGPSEPLGLATSAAWRTLQVTMEDGTLRVSLDHGEAAERDVEAAATLHLGDTSLSSAPGLSGFGKLFIDDLWIQQGTAYFEEERQGP